MTVILRNGYDVQDFSVRIKRKIGGFSGNLCLKKGMIWSAFVNEAFSMTAKIRVENSQGELQIQKGISNK